MVNDNRDGGGWKGGEGSVALGEKKKAAYGLGVVGGGRGEKGKRRDNAIRCWLGTKDFQV
jgi:hypothetical protein